MYVCMYVYVFTWLVHNFDDMLCCAEERECLDKLMGEIRSKIEETLGKDAQSGQQLRQVFSDIDKDGSSSIDKKELVKALDILKVELSPEDVNALFSRFDGNGDGRIDYGEFLQLVGFMSEAAGRSGDSALVDTADPPKRAPPRKFSGSAQKASPRSGNAAGSLLLCVCM